MKQRQTAPKSPKSAKSPKWLDPWEFLQRVRKRLHANLYKVEVRGRDPGDIQALMIVDAAKDLVRAEEWFKFLVERQRR